jgi:ABC-type oligopeptide transport system substrate-binding subunit
MKRTRIIILGVVFLSALTIAACGSKKVKESAETKKTECCEKKDSAGCEKKDSTKCEKKCAGEEAKVDSTKKN